MKQVGITEDDKMVVADILYLYETHGLPLFAVFAGIKENDLMFSVPHLIEECIVAGWKKKTMLSKLRDPIMDVYGEEQWRRMVEYIEWKEQNGYTFKGD